MLKHQTKKPLLLITLLLIISPLILITGSTETAITPFTAVYNSANGHYYDKIYGSYSWAQAQASASSMVNNGLQGHLVTINSQEENDFIVNNIGVATYSGLGCWLGGYQPSGSSEPAGGWQWVTGETWDYTNWASGEPNNHAGDGKAEERLIFLDNTPSGVWNDVPLSDGRGFIVEFENDLQVVDVQPLATEINNGDSLAINIKLANLGINSQTMTVQATAIEKFTHNQTALKSKDTSIAGQSNAIINLDCQQVQLFPGTYNIFANITSVTGRSEYKNDGKTSIDLVNASVYADWLKTRDPYSAENYGSAWSGGGNCYGLCSTAILYYMRYRIGDQNYPAYPVQAPIAASTYQLKLPHESDPVTTLNSPSLAVMFHQVYDPANQWTGYNTENQEFIKLIEQLIGGLPTQLSLHGHAVIAYGVQPIGDGTFKIMLSNPNCPQDAEYGIYNPQTQTFAYQNYVEFNVKSPRVIQSSWVPLTPTSSSLQSWEHLSQGYNFILVSKPVTISSPGVESSSISYFGSTDSGSFIGGIPGSAGIKEGNIEVYAIPTVSQYTIHDPTNDKQSIIMIAKVVNSSGTLSYQQLVVNATSDDSLNFTVTPQGNSIVIASTTAVSASISLLCNDGVNNSIAEINNIQVNATATANCTANWLALNTTRVEITIISSNSSIPTSTPTPSTGSTPQTNPEGTRKPTTPPTTPPIPEMPSITIIAFILISVTVLGIGVRKVIKPTR